MIYSANDLYKAVPKRIQYHITPLFLHLNEINECLVDTKQIERERYIEINLIAQFHESNASYSLYTVWYTGEPVMILQQGGKNGTDYIEDFITHTEYYYKMIDYIRNRYMHDRYSSNVINRYERMECLTNVDGVKLEINES